MWLWFFSVSALLQFWYTFCLNCPTALHWVAGAKAAVKGVVSIGCTLVAIPSVKNTAKLYGDALVWTAVFVQPAPARWER